MNTNCKAIIVGTAIAILGIAGAEAGETPRTPAKPAKLPAGALVGMQISDAQMAEIKGEFWAGTSPNSGRLRPRWNNFTAPRIPRRR